MNTPTTTTTVVPTIVAAHRILQTLTGQTDAAPTYSQLRTAMQKGTATYGIGFGDVTSVHFNRLKESGQVEITYTHKELSFDAKEQTVIVPLSNSFNYSLEHPQREYRCLWASPEIANIAPDDIQAAYSDRIGYWDYQDQTVRAIEAKVGHLIAKPINLLKIDSTLNPMNGMVYLVFYYTFVPTQALPKVEHKKVVSTQILEEEIRKTVSQLNNESEAGDIGFCRQQVNGPGEAYEIIQDTLAQAEVCFISIPPYENFLRSLNTQKPPPVFYYARVRDKYEAIKVNRKPVPGFPDGVEITFAYKFIHKRPPIDGGS